MKGGKKMKFDAMSFIVIVLCAAMIYMILISKKVQLEPESEPDIIYKETIIKQTEAPHYRRINIPSRGEMPAFKNIGYISNNNDQSGDKDVLPLYGRPIYRGSHKWNYYTMHEGVRIPLDGCDDTRGCDEKYDNNETVTISPLTNGDTYTVGLYNDGIPRYIPY